MRWCLTLPVFLLSLNKSAFFFFFFKNPSYDANCPTSIPGSQIAPFYSSPRPITTFSQALIQSTHSVPHTLTTKNISSWTHPISELTVLGRLTNGRTSSRIDQSRWEKSRTSVTCCLSSKALYRAWLHVWGRARLRYPSLKTPFIMSVQVKYTNFMYPQEFYQMQEKEKDLNVHRRKCMH